MKHTAVGVLSEWDRNKADGGDDSRFLDGK